MHNFQANQQIETIYGIWADKESQLIITGRYLIFFEKENDDIRAYACSYNFQSGKMILEIKAGVAFNKLRNTSNCIFRNSNNEIIQWGDIQNEIKKPQTIEIALHNNTADDSDFRIVLQDDKNLDFNFEGKTHTLKLIQKIELSNFVELPEATQENIGDCLNNWNNLALMQQGFQDQEVFSCSISLKNRDIHFNIVYGSVIYCNSNLIAANNNGRVWDQKIRLMNHSESGQFSILYPDNCYDDLNKEITIDNQLFKKDSCNFLPGMLRYWSLDSFTENQIVINGCGEKYTIDRIIEEPPREYNLEFLK